MLRTEERGVEGPRGSHSHKDPRPCFPADSPFSLVLCVLSALGVDWHKGARGQDTNVDPLCLSAFSACVCFLILHSR